MYKISATERNYLLNSMHQLLDEYDYSYDDYALNQIIDEWADQKGFLIEAFKKHPNYLDGKFMIAFDSNYEREIEQDAIFGFAQWLKYGPIESMASDVPEQIRQKTEEDCCSYLPNRLYWLLVEDLHQCLNTRTLNQEQANLINKIIPEAHAHNGQKTSRVINRICTYLGYNKHPNWNREYAKYADALSPMTITRHTVLSINPLDYLTMSFGNSWASCHTIDKHNKRRMPNDYSGCYSSGTMSYMLDSSSMVLYTIDKSYDGDEYWNQPKINRQMFHYGEEKLVQGRLYPQDNDSNAEGYTPFRNIVQAIMAIILDVPNLWTLKKGTDGISQYVVGRGTHYRDYLSYNNCTLSRLKDTENEKSFTIGAEPICIECGETHSTADNINCCYDGDYYICEDCGRRIHQDDVRWVGDYAYCDNCASYCDRCDSYERTEDLTWIESEDRYVCDWCRNEYYSYCEDCDEWYDYGNIRFVDSVNHNVCDDCLDEYYTCCDDCGEYFPNDDVEYLGDVDRYVCQSCLKENYTQCENCDSYVDHDDIVTMPDGTMLCEDCIATCEYCGQVLPKDDMAYIDGQYICRECEEEEEAC